MFGASTRYLGAVAVVTLILAISPRTVSGDFTPEHLYTPADGGTVIEWDQNLQRVGSFQIGNVGSVTGCVFNSRGNLILMAQDPISDMVRILEVNSAGTVLRSYDTGNNSLMRGSYIDFDPIRGVYAFANYHQVTWLDLNLGLLGTSQVTLDRASGVTFGPDGSLYATDSNSSNGIRKFGPNFNLEGTIPLSAWVSTGIAWGSDGRLLVTDFGNGSLARIDPNTGAREFVLTNLGYGKISDVLELPNRALVTISYGSPLKLYDPNGQLLATGGGASDSVAYYAAAPAPPAFGQPSRCRRWRG